MEMLKIDLKIKLPLIRSIVYFEHLSIISLSIVKVFSIIYVKLIYIFSNITVGIYPPEYMRIGTDGEFPDLKIRPMNRC